MPKKGLHLPDEYFFDRDFPAAAVLDILEKAAVQLFGDDENHFHVDITTLEGDFFSKLTFSELERYFLIFKNVINSITLIEKSSARRSIVLYLNTAPNVHNLSFSITTNQADEHYLMEIYVQSLLKKHTKAAKKTTKHQVHKDFLFEHDFTAPELVDFLTELSNSFLKHTPFRVEIYSKYDEVLVLSANDESMLLTQLELGEHRVLTLNKQTLDGSSINLTMYFSEHLPCFGYYALNAASSADLKHPKALINRKLNIDKQNQKQLKGVMVKTSVLQGVFPIDTTLNADQISDFLEMLGDGFLPDEDLKIRYINADNSCYRYEDGGIDSMCILLRSSGAGSIFSAKRIGQKQQFVLGLNAQNVRHRVGFYYISLGNFADNKAMENLLLKSLQTKTEASENTALDVRPQLQGSFFFPTNIHADAFVEFLENFSKTFFPDDFLALRINRVNGEKDFLYDEEYSELQAWIQKGEHEVIYLNKKTKNGCSISVHLQFKNEDNTAPNGYYSIVTENDKNNLAVRTFIQKNLRKNTQQIPDNQEDSLFPEKEKNTVVAPAENDNFTVNPIFKNTNFTSQKKCFIRLSNDDEMLFGALCEVLGSANLEGVKSKGLEGVKVLDTLWQHINESALLILDISESNTTAFYELGLAHTLGKEVILLVQDARELPFDFKRFKHIIYEKNEDGMERLKAELEAYLT